MSKPWRDAATLIVIARNKTKNQKFDYKLLTFKRTDKTSFMQNSMCFPGGGLDGTDEDKDWITFLKSKNIQYEQMILNPIDSNKHQKPFIFENHNPRSIHRDLSLRINAIRETFEEVGVVLCRDPLAITSNQSSGISDYFHSKDCDIVEWQNKIHDHKETLLSFCEKFNIVPDVSRLFEWSVWLTPAAFNRRFESIFYTVLLESTPPIYPESHEVQDFMWVTPEEIIKKHQAQELWLPPPQYYELCRLNGIKKFDEIAKFAKERNSKGSTLYMPHQLRLKDGYVNIFPGDDQYPENPNFYNLNYDMDEFSDRTLEDMRKNIKNLHRQEFRGLYNDEIFCNIEPFNDHLPFKSKTIPSKL